MKARSLVLSILTLSLVAAPAMVSAQGHGGGGPGGEGKERHFRAELNLTDDQKAKLKELHKQIQQVREDHMNQLKALRDKTRDELLKSNPSQSVLNDLARQMGDLERTFTEKRTDHLLKVKAIFTPEQFSKMMERELGDRPPEFGRKGDMKGCPKAGMENCPHKADCPKTDCPHKKDNTQQPQ